MTVKARLRISIRFRTYAEADTASVVCTVCTPVATHSTANANECNHRPGKVGLTKAGFTSNSAASLFTERVPTRLDLIASLITRVFS
jgi:hypothetical protein